MFYGLYYKVAKMSSSLSMMYSVSSMVMLVVEYSLKRILSPFLMVLTSGPTASTVA